MPIIIANYGQMVRPRLGELDLLSLPDNGGLLATM